MATRNKSSLPALALLVALASPFAAQAKLHPYNARYEAQVSELFLTNGQPSSVKIDAYIARLEQKRTQVAQLLAQADVEKARQKNKDPKMKKIQAEADEDKLTVSISTAIANLQAMKTSKNLGQTMDLAYDALDLEDTVRVKGKDPAIRALVTHLKEVYQPWTINLKAQAADEASNLVAADGSFLSASDIAKLQAQNADLSQYNPGGNGEFWQAQKNISKINVHDAALGRTLKFYEGSDVEFAPDATYFLDEVVHADTKPKMAAYINGKNGKKIKFRLKFTNEVHAETSAAALSKVLGFPSDIHQFEKTVKVIIGKQTVSDIKRDWEVFYPRTDVREPKVIEDSIVESGTDAKLGNYIVFRNVSVEARPKGIDRIGGWQLGANGNDSLREARAMMAVSMWMDNTDYQDFKNVKLLGRIEDGRVVSKMHTVSDLGHSFGGVSQENPDVYRNKMIDSRSADQMKLTYRAFNGSPARNKMTYADFKWASRLIANLTRDQITTAISLGGWPTCVADLLVEKAISRRNDLVQNFGLIGEKLPDGSVIQLLPTENAKLQITMKQACGRDFAATEFRPGFRYDLPNLMGVLGRASSNIGLDIARGVIGGGATLRLVSGRANVNQPLNLGPIVEISGGAPRTIEKNPTPTSEKDLFIVKDEWEVRVRLGAQFGAYKDLVVSRRYSISYPVRTMDEGRLANGFVVNAFLPKDLMKGQVPERYVLKSETFMSTGEGLDLTLPTAFLSPRVRIGHDDKVFLGRAILDARDENQVLLYRDEAEYTQDIFQAALRVGILNLPIIGSIESSGHSDGRAVVLKRSDVQSDSKLRDNLAAAVANGDFSPFKNAEQKLTLGRDFESKQKSWNLLLWKGRTETDFDHIKLTEGDSTRDALQMRSTKSRSTGLIGAKETHSVRIEVSGNGSAPGARLVTVKAVGVDPNTKDKELSESYLRFINGLSLTGKKVINFSTDLGYSINGAWGKTLTESETTIYPEGVQKILSMTESQFWLSLAKVMGVSSSAMQATLNAYQASLTSTGSRDTSSLAARMNRSGIDNGTFNLIAHSMKVLSNLKKARDAKSEKKAYEKIGNVFREAVYGSGGFYESRVLAALNTVAGSDNIYGRHMITTVGLGGQNLLGEVPLVGEVGKRRSEAKDSYIIVKPQTALDLYNMFDSWF